MNWSSLATSVVAIILILLLVNFTESPLHFVCFVPILKLLPYIHSWIAVSWFFFLVQNTDLPSPSDKLLHLHIDNETLIQKLSILLLNFLKYLFVYESAT